MTQRVFQERRTYRRYRLMDASRLLPILGAGLLFGPVLIQSGEGAVATSRLWLYLLAAWLALVVLAAAIAVALSRILGAEAED